MSGTFSLLFPNSILDDSVKVVKPKEAPTRGAMGQSPAASSIQSPKPNSPGFLLGAGGPNKAFRAFSPYTGSVSGSRSGKQCFYLLLTRRFIV